MIFNGKLRDRVFISPSIIRANSRPEDENVLLFRRYVNVVDFRPYDSAYRYAVKKKTVSSVYQRIDVGCLLNTIVARHK